MSLLLLFYTSGEGGSGGDVEYIKASSSFRQVSIAAVSQQITARAVTSFTPTITASIRFEVVT